MKITDLREMLGDEWEDVVQQAHLECLERGDGDEKYFSRRMKDVAIDHIRDKYAQKRDASLEEELHEDEVAAEAPDLDVRIDVRRAMEILSPRMARAMLRHAAGEITMREAARELGVTEGSIGLTFSRIRSALRKELEGYGELK